MSTGCLNGFTVDERIVECVSGYELAFPFIAAISQAVCRLAAYTTTVEGQLFAAISRSLDIRDAWISIHVEALEGYGLYETRWA